MMKRRTLAAGLLAVSACALLGGASQVSAQARPSVSIGKARLDVARVAALGRVRILSLDVKPGRGSTVQSVTARAVFTGRSRTAGPASTLTNIGGTTYATSTNAVGVPNTTTRVNARIEVSVVVTSGGTSKTLTKVVGTVTVDPSLVDPNSPPPPPPI